jgi:hypothetical protein
MSETSEVLELLNRQTFDAEAQTLISGEHWREFLQRSLAANFSIRRANGAAQNKAEMIEFIAGSIPAKRAMSKGYPVEVIESIGSSGLAAVTCVIHLAGQTDNFRNTKIFARQPSDSWLCVYWQVQKLT